MTDPQPGTKSADGEDKISIFDVGVLLLENIRVIILLPIAAGVLAFAIAFVWPPTYTATARILPPAQQQGASAAIAAQLGALAGIVGSAVGLKNPADQYSALLKSRTVYDAIIERFKLRELYDERYIEDTRKELEKRTSFTAGAKDGIIVIEVDDRDPKRAAEIANAFIEELRNLTKTLAVTEAGQRRLFFETQLKQTKDNLTKSEIALRSSGVGEATIKAVPQSAVEALALAGGEGGQYIAKFREFKYNETLFELMAKQYELARLDEAREGSILQVVDAAIPPEKRSKPKRILTGVLAMAGALLLTLIYVFAREGFRKSVKDHQSARMLERLKAVLSRLRIR